ncbi:MAG: CHAD domain-containing protein [Hyphomicrobiaceae bacterium]|nr:MAG: CHAD domain-containing protein [Hyphomicrobiaceae bacterium]
MTYRFKLQEPVGAGVRRIALEQIEIADEKLASQRDIATCIHDARRCLKRLKALMRLVRPALDDDVYRREAARLSGVGRLLSSERDQHVIRQTVTKLENRFGALPNGASQRLKELLQVQAASLLGSEMAESRRQALSRLKQTRRFFSGAGIAGVRFDHLADGLERSYRKARRAFRTAYDEPADEAFHAWRKSVQLHWRHMQLLSRGWPEMLTARAGEAKELSRLLGDDHDFAVLLTYVTNHAGEDFSPDDQAVLSSLCRSCQAELRASAKPRGKRLLAESATSLRDKIELYWEAACRLSALAAAKEQEEKPEPKADLKRVRRGSR